VQLQSICVISDGPSYWTSIPVGQFHFFEKKKRYLVNCVHTALAILGYSHLRKKHIDPKDQPRQVLSIVIDGLLLDPEVRRVIDVFLEGKAMQLLLEERSDKRPAEFADDEDAYVELVSKGKLILDRMSAFPDAIGRVLQTEDDGDDRAQPKMLSRVELHIKDLKRSIARADDEEGRGPTRSDYRSFAARDCPHVREVDRAITTILDAWGDLMKD
jgi:hypothetical protein